MIPRCNRLIKALFNSINCCLLVNDCFQYFETSTPPSGIFKIFNLLISLVKFSLVIPFFVKFLQTLLKFFKSSPSSI